MSFWNAPNQPNSLPMSLRRESSPMDNKPNKQRIRRFQKKTTSPGKISGPVRIHVSQCSDDLSLVYIHWKGDTVRVPEVITCLRCKSMMTLSMRRVIYRGELNEYPSYRCVRKGCQTFRSVKSYILKTQSDDKSTSDECEKTNMPVLPPSEVKPDDRVEWTNCSESPKPMSPSKIDELPVCDSQTLSDVLGKENKYPPHNVDDVEDEYDAPEEFDAEREEFVAEVAENPPEELQLLGAIDFLKMLIQQRIEKNDLEPHANLK